MFKPHVILLCFLATSVFNLTSQTSDIPANKIHLLDFELIDDSFIVKRAQYLTDFNTNNYNNQPYFLSEDLILITSHTGQDFTDILQLNLSDESYFRFTSTEGISEFSPKSVPKSNMISCVRIEKDQKSQSLYQYPFDRKGYGNRMFTQVDNFGYYEWLDSENLIAFMVNDPPTLKLYNINEIDGKTITSNVGRCIKAINSYSFYYVAKTETKMLLKKYDLNQRISQIVKEIKSEDFELDQYGNVFSIVDDQIWVLRNKLNSDWLPVKNLNVFGIKNASRLAILKNKMAIVSEG